jgi:hypothetical protein
MDAVTARRIVLMFLGLVILSTGMTLVFVSMRAIMDIGGMCATGGAYVVATPCPDGVAALMPLGIIGGLAGLWLYGVNSAKLPGPRLIFLAWSALFLSLGWNFWEFGLNPPDGSDGVVWGWIICGVTFVAMGGLPLLGLTNRGIAKQVFWADAPNGSRSAPVSAPRPARVATGSPDSLGDALEQLARLHSSGALSDEEFRIAKQRILGGQA